MQLGSLSPLTRRFVAISLVALMALLLADGLLRPVLGAFVQQSQRIDDLESNYRRFAEIASRKEGLEATIKRLEADKVWRSHLLDAPTAGEASTVLQQRIRSAAEAAGVQLESFQPIEAQAPHGFVKPGVRLELEASAEPLAIFLETLRNAPELVVFENVSLRGAGRGSAREKLKIRMELSGYWYPQGGIP